MTTWRKRKENTRLLRQRILHPREFLSFGLPLLPLSLFFTSRLRRPLCTRGNIFTSENIFGPQTLSDVRRYFNARSNKAPGATRKVSTVVFPPKFPRWKMPLGKYLCVITLNPFAPATSGICQKHRFSSISIALSLSLEKKEATLPKANKATLSRIALGCNRSSLKVSLSLSFFLRVPLQHSREHVALPSFPSMFAARDISGARER